MLIIQFYFIIGIITQLKSKELFFKIMPFIPLNILVYFIPNDVYICMNILILFVVSIAIKPKARTLFNFVITMFLISIMQLGIIWLRINIFNLIPPFPDVIKMLIMNIDQYIVLFLLYCLSIKGGENNDTNAIMAFFRRKR